MKKLEQFAMTVFARFIHENGKSKSWTVNPADPTHVEQPTVYVGFDHGFSGHKRPDIEPEPGCGFFMADDSPEVYEIKMTESWGVSLEVRLLAWNEESNEYLFDNSFQFSAVLNDQNMWNIHIGTSDFIDDDLIWKFILESCERGTFEAKKDVFNPWDEVEFDLPMYK